MSASQLIGTWTTDPADRASQGGIGVVTIVFDADGSLRCIIDSVDKSEVIQLSYSVDGDTIFTNQASAPRVEATTFVIDGAGRLHLSLDGQVSRFVRVPDQGA